MHWKRGWTTSSGSSGKCPGAHLGVDDLTTLSATSFPNSVERRRGRPNVRKHCVLPFHVKSHKAEEVRVEIAERLVEELQMVQASVGTWKSTGAFTHEASDTVADDLRQRVSALVHSWPSISKDPAAEREDGRS